MYEEILEKNSKHIKNIKIYRSCNTEVKEIVHILNTKKIMSLSWLQYTGKTQLIHVLLKKTGNLENALYFNGDLDVFQHIHNRKELTTLFDLFVRIHGVPKMVVLQNIHHIEWIKSFISDLYKTQKYKIFIVENVLKLSWVQNMDFFPLAIDKNNLSVSHFWGIPQVRIIPDISYKGFVLENLKNNFLYRIHTTYWIKNMQVLSAMLTYLGGNSDYESLREIHRNMKAHWTHISLLTMIDYINAALGSKIISRIFLHDIKNNNTLSSKARYYFGDVWLKQSFESNSDSLENLIYLELKILWYEVTWWLNGRFQFAFRTIQWKRMFSIAIDQSWDKNEVRKTARKLEKIWDTSIKLVVVPNKNSLNMRKFQEESVKIVDLGEFLDILRR